MILSALVVLALASCALGTISERVYLAALLLYLYFAGVAFIRVFVSLGRSAPAA